MVYTKTIIHLSVGESGGYLPPFRWIIVNYYYIIIIIIIIIISSFAIRRECILKLLHGVALIDYNYKCDTNV